LEDVVRRFITIYIRTVQTNFECQSTFTGVDSISPESRWTLATFGVVVLHNHLRKKAYINIQRKKACMHDNVKEDGEDYLQYKQRKLCDLGFLSNNLHC